MSKAADKNVITKEELRKRALIRAGALSDAARHIVGGHGLSFTYRTCDIYNLSELLEELRKRADDYDAAIIELSSTP